MSAVTKGYATAREMFQSEYGTSKNMLTPNVVTYGGVLDGPRPFAFEVASGEGIIAGSVLVGVSVVVGTAEGVERSYDLSTAFSGDDINATIDQALAYVGKLDELLAREVPA